MSTNVLRGLRCPTCYERTRVLHTVFQCDRALRQRLCEDCALFFVTQEMLIADDPTDVPPDERDGGYPCPECGERSAVLQTRNARQLVKRKRCCTHCGYVFRTKEYPQP